MFSYFLTWKLKGNGVEKWRSIKFVKEDVKRNRVEVTKNKETELFIVDYKADP